MKIKCRKQPLIKALQTINAVAAPRDLYPILENVKISALDQQVFFQATDLNISLTYLFGQDQVEVLEEGELLIPALKFYSLAKEIADIEIAIESKENNGVIVCEDGYFSIQGEDIAKFPAIPEFQEHASIEIAGENLQKLIKKTLFATTAEKTRYDLDNVLGELAGESLRFVATDGKRLAVCERPCKNIGKITDVQFTVPSKGLQQIEKVLGATTPQIVMLSFLENQLLFRSTDVVLSTRLSDAKFPPYERVLPKGLPYKAEFLLKDFSSALRRVCLLADDKNKIVELSFASEALKFYAMGEGTGEARVQIPVNFDGDPFDIKFNPVFLLDVLKIIDNVEVNFLLKNGQTAALLKDGEDFQYVILPIKVEGSSS